LNWIINGINTMIDGYNNIPKFGLPNIGHIPQLAAGGIVPPGGAAIAGEPGAGQELILGGMYGATVLKNAQTQHALGGGGGRGGGGTAVIHHHYSPTINIAVTG